MIGVFAEDDSDFQVLKILIRRLLNKEQFKVVGKGYTGHGELFKDAPKEIQRLSRINVRKFVVCTDSDGKCPDKLKNSIHENVFSPSGCGIAWTEFACALVPVQEIEAWMLSDEVALSKVCKGWRPVGIPNPESIASPKEYLCRLSRASNRRPRYVPAIDNPRTANYLNLSTVAQKCASFRTLREFIIPKNK